MVRTGYSGVQSEVVYVFAFSIHAAAILQGERACALCGTRARWHKSWDLSSCSD